MPRDGPVPVWRRQTDMEMVYKDPFLTPVCAAQPSSTPLPIRTFQVVKEKEKKQIIFLYIGVVVYQQYETRPSGAPKQVCFIPYTVASGKICTGPD